MNNNPAPISTLVKRIRVRNLVPDILETEDGEDVLQKIANRVIEDYQSDKTSMEGWEKFLDAGRKLAVQELSSKSEPWEGAANFKSPAMLEAALRFGDRASSTLLKDRDLVKFDVIGPDPEGEKRARGERLITHMNYQLNYEMKTWRDDHDGMMYILPMDGVAFKFSYFDSGLGANVSEIVRWPDFAVSQANTHIETCRSFSIVREFSQSVVLSKMREEIWYEWEDFEFGTETQAEQREESESMEKFFVQQMFYDLDEDGYEEPYMAVVHEGTTKVMRLYARYEEENVMVKTPNGRVLSLDKVLDGADNLGMTGEDRLGQCRLVRIEPINCITSYDFIPGVLLPFEKEGSFLGIGYVHLLAALTQAINSSSNTILNAGKLASTPGGFLAKNFHRAKGVLSYKMGQFIQTLMSPSELQSAVLPFQFQDVSQGFYAFNEKMRAEIERIAASTDLSEAVGANAPATTMLGMVQEKMMPLSALIMRIHRAQKMEFIKLADLNRKYTDPVQYKELIEGEGVDFVEDYRMAGLDVMPASNPEQTSKIQNILQSSAAMEQFDRILQAGGNPLPVLKQYLANLGLLNLGDVFPDKNQEKEQDPNLVAMQESIKMEREIAKASIKVEEGKLRNDRLELGIKFMKTKAEIKEILSQVILNAEKAETEDTKNQMAKYTHDITAQLEAFEGEEEGRQLEQYIQDLASVDADFIFDPQSGQIRANSASSASRAEESSVPA